MSEPRQIKPGSVAAIVAQANRFHALKGSPGFYDLVDMAKLLSDEATNKLVDYPGYDAQEIVVLKARAQAAKELVAELFNRIDAAIEQGKSLPGFVQQAMPEPVEEIRIAGSYA